MFSELRMGLFFGLHLGICFGPSLCVAVYVLCVAIDSVVIRVWLFYY
jgi:hypothetical protein